MNWINRGTLVLQGNIDKGVNMKKALAIFITVCLLASLFVSCDNTTKLDELVSTRFDAAESRSLIVSNEDFIGFNDPSIKWQYKAEKVSDTSYNVGAAAGWTLIPAKEYAIGDLRNSIEFSQGKWNFWLRAVKTADTSVEVYYGETELPVLLTKKDGIRTISINLSTQHEGQKGYIVLDTIQVKHTSNGDVAYDAPSKVIIDDADAIKRRELVLGTDYVMSEARDSISSMTETGFETSVGTHTVKVQKIGDNREILAEEEKTIEVYAGLKTTISNWIVEMTQAGKFVVFTDTDSTDISVPSEGSSVDVVFSGITPSMVNDNNTTVTLPSSTLTGVESPKLSVAVKQASEASVDGAFNATDSEKVIAAVIDLRLSSSSGLIENFGENTVIVSTYVAKNLAGFKFGYPGENGWNSVDNEAEVNAAKEYWYDSESGKLVFGTNHFSSFIVETSSAAIIGDTAYKTLADAINGASDGDTIVLLDNTSVSNTSITLKEGKTCISIQDKGITIDGNGKAITLSADAPDNNTYGICITGDDSSKTVAIKNATINTTKLERAIRAEGSIGVNIVDCTISTNGVGVHVKGSNKVDIINTHITVNVIDNEVYTAHLRTAVMVGGEDADVTVNGCTINAINTNKITDTKVLGYQNSWCKGLYVGTHSKNAKITANDTKVEADFSIAIDGAQNDYTAFEGKPTQIIINSGEYSGLFGSPSGLSYKSLIINGGTFTGISDFKNFNSKDNDVAKLVISGGTFNIEPASKYIDDGYYAELNEDGKYEVKKATNWIQVADTSWYNETESEFTISNARELSGLALLVNEGNNFSGKTIKLVSSIDLSGKTWTPIGAYSGKSFCGIFDGNSYTISNLKIDSAETPYDANGLFGFISKQNTVNSSVKNIIICNANINAVSNGNGGIGVAIGNVFPGCTIDNIKVFESTVVGNRWIGGIVGSGYCTISNCSVENISLTANQDYLTDKWDNGDKVGGIIGYLREMSGDPKLTSCKAKDVTIVGYRDLGGIAGLTQSNLASNIVDGSLNIKIQFKENYKNYTRESITVGEIFGNSAAHYSSDNSTGNTSSATYSIDKTALDN